MEIDDDDDEMMEDTHFKNAAKTSLNLLTSFCKGDCESRGLPEVLLSIVGQFPANITLVCTDFTVQSSSIRPPVMDEFNTDLNVEPDALASQQATSANRTSQLHQSN